MNDNNINNRGNNNVNINGNGNTVTQINYQSQSIETITDINFLAQVANKDKQELNNLRFPRYKKIGLAITVGIFSSIPPIVKIILNIGYASSYISQLITQLFQQDKKFFILFLSSNWFFISCAILALLSFAFARRCHNLNDSKEDENNLQRHINKAKNRAFRLGYTEKQWKQARKNPKNIPKKDDNY